MTDKIKTGEEGEDLAAAFLIEKGFTVLERNYRNKKSEIDLIVSKGNWLVFVEVKTRRGSAHGAPIEAVDARKVERLRSIALAYLSVRDAGGEEPACRFDIAEVRSGRDGLSSVRLHRGVQSET